MECRQESFFCVYAVSHRTAESLSWEEDETLAVCHSLKRRIYCLIFVPFFVSAAILYPVMVELQRVYIYPPESAISSKIIRENPNNRQKGGQCSSILTVPYFLGLRMTGNINRLHPILQVRCLNFAQNNLVLSICADIVSLFLRMISRK